MSCVLSHVDAALAKEVHASGNTVSAADSVARTAAK
jgi:hypothetical protein